MSDICKNSVTIKYYFFRFTAPRAEFTPKCSWYDLPILKLVPRFVLIDFAPTCYIQCKEMQNCILFIIYKDNLYILFVLGVLCTARKVLPDFAIFDR